MRDPTVQHDPARHRFVAHLDEGDARLIYAERDGGTLDLHHTEVPAPVRGRGVASALVRAAVDHARERGIRLIATCPYVRRWRDRHPDAADVFSEP